MPRKQETRGALRSLVRLFLVSGLFSAVCVTSVGAVQIVSPKWSAVWPIGSVQNIAWTPNVGHDICLKDADGYTQFKLISRWPIAELVVPDSLYPGIYTVVVDDDYVDVEITAPDTYEVATSSVSVNKGDTVKCSWSTSGEAAESRSQSIDYIGIWRYGIEENPLCPDSVGDQCVRLPAGKSSGTVSIVFASTAKDLFQCIYMTDPLSSNKFERARGNPFAANEAPFIPIATPIRSPTPIPSPITSGGTNCAFRPSQAQSCNSGCKDSVNNFLGFGFDATTMMTYKKPVVQVTCDSSGNYPSYIWDRNISRQFSDTAATSYEASEYQRSYVNSFSAGTPLYQFGFGAGATAVKTATKLITSKKSQTFWRRRFIFREYGLDADWGLPLDKSFKSAVTGLETISDFDSVVSRYGTHYVSQVTLGGEIQTLTALQHCEYVRQSSASVDVAVPLYWYRTIGLDLSSSFDIATEEKVRKSITYAELKVIGGVYTATTCSQATWMADVEQCPAVVLWDLRRISTLFGDDKEKLAMDAAIDRYLAKAVSNAQTPALICGAAHHLAHTTLLLAVSLLAVLLIAGHG